MPELDSVRGVAVLLVLFFHSFGFQYGTKNLSGVAKLLVSATLPGWTGVNLFFVLSGFLITGILIDSRNEPDYYRTFYIRRALRILPIYYVLLVVLFVLPRIGLIDRHVSLGFLGLSFIYLSNVVNLFGVTVQYATLWSLSIEEHFYLFWPTVVRTFSRRTVGICASGIFLLCPALRALVYEMGYESGPYTWLLADGLAAGALMAVLLRRPSFTRTTMRRFSALCVVAATLMFALGYPFGILHPVTLVGFSLRETALNVLYAGALGTVLLLGTSHLKWLVRRPTLRFFGSISYGLYLYQRLVFDVVDHFALQYAPHLALAIKGNFGLMMLRFLLGGGCAIMFAFLSRKYFESRFIQMKDRWAIAKRSPIVNLETSARPQSA